MKNNIFSVSNIELLNDATLLNAYQAAINKAVKAEAAQTKLERVAYNRYLRANKK